VSVTGIRWLSGHRDRQRCPDRTSILLILGAAVIMPLAVILSFRAATERPLRCVRSPPGDYLRVARSVDEAF
jgi:hypothetical protein